jgi:peptidoglycan hydrolase-like protein with peptidoglycan-binding domain
MLLRVLRIVLWRRSSLTACAFVVAGGAIAGNALLLQPERPRPAVAPAVAAPTAQLPAPDPLVRSIQAELQQSGLYEGAVDGLAGPRTRDAIRAFEAALGRPATGEASEALLVSLRSRSTASAPATEIDAEPAAMAPAPFDARIAAIQTALAQSAYGPLNADGRYGPQTREAIKRFQTDHSLPATGEISDALVVELRAIGALEGD